MRPKLPRIGPTRCPLELWFVEFQKGATVFRRYYADRSEARAALRVFKQTGRLPASGEPYLNR